jgi:hypothetical protein
MVSDSGRDKTAQAAASVQFVLDFGKFRQMAK